MFLNIHAYVYICIVKPSIKKSIDVIKIKDPYKNQIIFSKSKHFSAYFH